MLSSNCISVRNSSSRVGFLNRSVLDFSSYSKLMVDKVAAFAETKDA